jgi:ClpP class serine protease
MKLIRDFLGEQLAIDMDALQQLMDVDIDAASEVMFDRREPVITADQVGFIGISGPITARESEFSKRVGFTALDRLTLDFLALENNPNISHIVALVDTPGGGVKGVADFAELVAGSNKKTIAYSYSAQSAGYWIASAFDKIVANPTGVIGSVGVVATIKTNSKNVVEIVSSKAPLKRADVTSEEGRASAQLLVDDLTEIFIGAVAKNRGVSAETVESDFGRGASISAARALEAGMIDSVQSLDALVSSLTTEGSHMDENKTFEAKEQERARIQAIEAIADKFDGSAPEIKAAVSALVKEEKFNPEATSETVGLQALEAIAGLKFEPPKKEEAPEATAPVAEEPKAIAADEQEQEMKRKSAEMAAGLNAQEPTEEDMHEAAVNSLLDARAK